MDDTKGEIPDQDIDTSEVPELGDEFFANATLTRPGERLIPMEPEEMYDGIMSAEVLLPEFLAWLQAQKARPHLRVVRSEEPSVSNGQADEPDVAKSFPEHLDGCHQCQESPFKLCPTGLSLLHQSLV